MTVPTPDEVTDAVLADLGRAPRGVVVDSPPGAGKSTLVVRVASMLADAGEDLVVVAQTNEQVDDLVDRLATERPELAIGRLAAQDYVPSARISRHPNVSVSSQAGELGAVVITTEAKLAMVKTDRTWPWAIIDEAYQMRSDLLLQIASCFSRALFVGDPGQLDPFTLVDIERWKGLSWDPVQSAVAVLLRHNPDIPVHTLPVSWRLPFSAAPVVSEAFYPFTGFRSATDAADRSVSFVTRALPSPYDSAIELAAASGWAMYSLPARHTVRTDADAVTACVGLAARVLQRGAVAVSEHSPSGSPITADRVAIGAAHRD
jgi:AAA domain